MKETILSYISNATGRETADISVGQAVEDIRSGRYRQAVQDVRSAYQFGGKKEAGPLKKQLPAILFSGHFKQRNTEGIEQHSGILVADLDGLAAERIEELRARLKEDLHVLLCFLSPTASGLKVGFRVPADADRHADSFAAVATHVKEKYGEDIDQACKDLARLCFVSHDPELYVNWEAKEMEVTKLAKPFKLTDSTDLAPRKKVAEEMFGPVDWVDETKGKIQCPGQESHTNPSAPQDCTVYIDGVPNINCFHSSCADSVKEANVRLKGKIAGEVVSSENKQVYYDANNKHYWRQNNRGGWLTNNERQVSRALRKWGISDKRREGELTSPVDDTLLDIQQDRDVQYAGRLAGYMAGMHEVFGRRILVTESPQLIEPAEGTWPILGQIIDGLLCADGPVQREHLFGWLKVAIEALREGKRRPGQALAFCGIARGGKSLLQNLIITKLLGGRLARPYQFMAGKCPHNADLFGAEHLIIEDDLASADIRSRRAFGTAIKAFTVNVAQHCHGKYKDAIELTPFWRVTISINDEPEHLQVLPPMDDSLEDKIMLLKAYKKPLPLPNDTLEEREKFDAVVESELPAFVHYLLNDHTIPKEMICPRFGVTHYHHPAVLSALGEFAPETRLLSIVDAVVFTGPLSDDWCGTAEELQRRLRDSDYAHEAGQLLKYSQTCGNYLSRLAKQKPPRVINQRTEHRREWLIKPPGPPNDTMTPSSIVFSGENREEEGADESPSHRDLNRLPSCRQEADKPAYQKVF